MRIDTANANTGVWCNRVCIAVAAVVLLIAPISSLCAERVTHDVLARSGVRGGLVVHLGCGDGRETAAFLVSDSFLVNGIDTNVASVDKARKHIQSLGLYGKISVDAFDGEHLPYADNVVNLIVGREQGKVSAKEIQRVLVPLGVAIVTGKTITKPWPKNIGEWTHFLHGPDNNAVCNDSVVGPPRHMQWLADPLWLRHHGMLASVQAPVSAAGRLYYIMDKVWMGATTNAPDWRLVARDAFNGKWLWDKRIPTWTDFTRGFRSGPTQVQRVLVTDSQYVYAVLSLNGPVSVLDARTGCLVRVLPGTKKTEEFVVHDGVVFAVVAAEKTEQAYGAKDARRSVPTKVASAKCVKVIDAKTGAGLWRWPKNGTTNIIPMTLAASADSVYLQKGDSVVRLDRRTGRERWTTATKPVDPSKSRPGPRGVARRLGWSVATLVVSDGVVLSTNGQELVAMACDSGKVLWRTGTTPTFLAGGVDVLVNDGQVWLGSYFTQSLDLRTGKVTRVNDLTRSLLTANHHHRCYRNKGTSRFVIMSKRGAEFLDLTGDAHSRNNWIRGVCQYGMLPCNGLLYVPPHQCGCYKEAKLFGFWALAPERRINVVPAKERLSRGPAYGIAAVEGADVAARGDSWPMYRRDEVRSGVTPHKVGATLTEAWRTRAVRDLTAPVVAGGIVIAASRSSHQVHAFNAETGKSLWSFTTGGRVDSPPTLHAGLALFGSSDGKVYCLRASDGRLVWSFHAALGTERTVVQERLESLWPVSGSVLVKNGICYFVSGRSSYLDGGLRLYGLDPFTGAVKHETVLQSKHAGVIDEPPVPREAKKKTKIDYKTVHAPDKSDAFFMEGNIADILVTDGSSIYLRHMKFDTSLVRQEGYGAHLQSTATLLDRTAGERLHWMIGGGDFRKLPKSSYQWMTKPRHKNFGQFVVPFGKMLVFNERMTWGMKHLERSGGLRDALNLFCQKMDPPKLGDSGKDWEYRLIPKPVWDTDLDMRPRALLKAGPHLYVAGVAIKDFSGKKGDLADKAGILDVYVAATGKRLTRHPLASPPVFDGLAAVGGRLFVSSHNGSVVCLKGPGRSKAPSVQADNSSDEAPMPTRGVERLHNK
ncbi:MAG: PQQ-binding-like beta-propeller repeat protein [Phycisphaerae bacterium]|nr:PQQ-binding-like beta-propeller repeat protein [Phycisphaerae bacterium]